MPLTSKVQHFQDLDKVKSTFGLTSELALGDPSYDRFIEHPVFLQQNGDDPIFVQIGRLIGDTYHILPELAQRAEAIHQRLDRYHQGGDHNGYYTISLRWISDDTFRICADADEGNEDGDLDIDGDTLDELMSAFADISRM